MSKVTNKVATVTSACQHILPVDQKTGFCWELLWKRDVTERLCESCFVRKIFLQLRSEAKLANISGGLAPRGSECTAGSEKIFTVDISFSILFFLSHF
jgi:hypothetical protein